MSDNLPAHGSGSRAGSLLSNRYRLEERIGAGGMGEVWRATDTLLSRPVAVKMLHTAQMGEPVSRQRFRTEAQITAALSHAGIAQVYDYGEQDDTAFLVMELVPGEPLSTIIKRNPGLDPDIALDVLDQAAQALAAAHAHGVVHRDIKPGNLLVTAEGAVKLTDFGIARGNESVTLTQTGMVMGTAQYISPEQVSGRPATQSSDIYALGVVAYECLAGRPPFTSDTPLALALAHARETPPPLPASVPAPVRALVERMLEKEPQDRPASAVEISQQAQRLRGGAGGADSTETMDLAEAAERTMVAAAVLGTGPYPARTGGQPGRTAPEEEWPPAGATGSDRVAGQSAPNRRLNLPVVFAVAATVVVVALGIVIFGQLWGGPDETATPTSNESAISSPSPSPSADVETDQDVPVPEPGGQNEPSPVQEDTPEPTTTPSPEVPSPSPETPTSPTGDPEVPDEDTDTGDDGTGDDGEGSDDDTGGGAESEPRDFIPSTR